MALKIGRGAETEDRKKEKYEMALKPLKRIK